MAPILDLCHISRSFPGVQALDDVTFSIAPGSVHALVGENGAGKSTLIKILSGALEPDSGSMQLADRPYRPRDPRAAIRAGVSTIYQELNLLPLRSVLANITLGQEPARGGILDLAGGRAQARGVLDLLKAAHIPLDAPVERLKVSEKQIVEIAKALRAQSRLLIMDEPTAALNSSEIEALFEIIATLKARGVTILYVSHRLPEIFRLADAVTVLRDGRRIRTAPSGEVTPDTLIADMIGRKLEGVFPSRNRDLGEVALSVAHLSAGGVFEDVSFEVRAGEVLAITGLTGSGKTELGKALFGDWPIDAGQVQWFGRVARANPFDAVAVGLGYLPEDRKVEGVLAEVSVRRNIALAILPRLARRFGVIDRSAERRVAEEQARALAIKTPSLDQLVRNLSGGNQQKVALAKWLACGARALILMEPTQGIDVGVKFEIYELIARLARERAAILLISSELPEILGLAHRILVMRAGRVVAEAPGAQADSETILRYALGNDT
ncbi:MAG TPA: sugar ABC transporter ATP-binding protein [Anaerolineae bacterium]|nr:sugar ABC transporter ATP-binding protein [Anaerolineae bacterium]